MACRNRLHRKGVGVSAGIAVDDGAGRTHLAQFYGTDDRALVLALARYVRDGLSQGGGVLVLSTIAHWSALLAELRREGVDATAAERDGSLVVLDAEAVRSGLVSDGEPRWDSFDSIVGTVVRRLQARCEPAGLRVFGEVVGLLWQDGCCTAALRLEELWNRLLETTPFQLFCAYPIDVLGEPFGPAEVGPVLCEHTHLLLPGQDAGEPMTDVTVGEVLARTRTQPSAEDPERSVMKGEERAAMPPQENGWATADGSAPPAGAWSQVGFWTVGASTSLAMIRRRVVAAALRDRAGLPESDPAAKLAAASERLSLVCGELAANGLRHGQPPVTVTLARGPQSWLLVVSDREPAKVPRPWAPDLSAGARLGLPLVRAASRRVGWYVEGATKHVWAEIGDRPPPGLLRALAEPASDRL
jgi:hypothetical protein